MGSSGRTPKLPRQKDKLKAPKGKSWEEAAVDGSFRRSLREGSMRFKPLEVLTPDSAPLPVHSRGPILIREGSQPSYDARLILSPEEQYVVFAALAAMVADVHAVQDQMSDKQWDVAEKLYKRLTEIVDKREARSCKA